MYSTSIDVRKIEEFIESDKTRDVEEALEQLDGMYSKEMFNCDAEF